MDLGDPCLFAASRRDDAGLEALEALLAAQGNQLDEGDQLAALQWKRAGGRGEAPKAGGQYRGGCQITREQAQYA